MREDGKIDDVELPGTGLAMRTPLSVLHANHLKAMQAWVEAAGGSIVKPIHAFPGGGRFHFHDPAGTELAVWSDA